MQFLVILRVKPGIPNEQIGSLVKPEAQKVWEGIKSGLVRQIWYFTDTEGAIGGAIGMLTNKITAFHRTTTDGSG